ncbi:MAG: ScpA family protein [Parvibaculaceae bacterium]|nr:ScpA family protein [Parvibaculaceae bacterium]
MSETPPDAPDDQPPSDADDSAGGAVDVVPSDEGVVTEAESDKAADRPQADGFQEDEGAPKAPMPDDGLIVDLDGYEGPLDVLLAMARTQKVDITKISILALANQYLEFINNAKRLELDLAADYLVMASWLAFLKSKLLLPPPDEEEGPSGEEMAAILAFQLRRLEAMRKASQDLMARHRMGVSVFGRGMPEGVRVIKTPEWQGKMYDLLKAYVNQRLRGHEPKWEPKKFPVLSIEEARNRIENMLGIVIDWGRIESFLPPGYTSPEKRRSAIASTFSATLELVKHGHLEIKQMNHFEPVYVRRRAGRDAKMPQKSNQSPETPNGEASEE